MSKQKKLLFHDRELALWVGYVGIIISTVALWDAYEGSGVDRPFLQKLVPGL